MNVIVNKLLVPVALLGVIGWIVLKLLPDDDGGGGGGKGPELPPAPDDGPGARTFDEVRARARKS